MGFVQDIFDTSSGEDELRNAERLFAELQLPDFQQHANEIQALLDSGLITPEDVAPILQAESGLGSITTDPRLRDAQFNALDQLIEIGAAGGLTATDRARINDIVRDENAIERGSREAILQNAQARGAGGSNLELASQLISGQSSADRRADRGFDVAALAEQRALDAIMNAGQLGGNIRAQEFGEASEKAKAQDIINAFNTQNQNQALFFNAQNQGEELNRRLALLNELKGTEQQDFENRLRQLAGQTGQLQNIAGLEEGQRERGSRTAGAALGAAGTALSGRV